MVNYPRLSSSNVRGLGVFNVILWLFSSTLNSIICVRYSNFGNGTSYDPLGALDYVVTGIWAGLLYGIAGLIGLCASYNREKSQLIAAAIFNVLSIGGGIICAIISGIIGSHIVNNKEVVCNPDQVYPPIFSNTIDTDCTVWYALEFSLMGISVGAIITNLASLFLIVFALGGPVNISDDSSRAEQSINLSVDDRNQTSADDTKIINE